MDIQTSSGELLDVANYVSHLAVYDAPLSATRVLAHYHAGLYAWGHPFGERSGDRCERVLDEIGWPDELRNIDTGDTVHGPYLPAAQSALAYLRSVETTEDGGLFFGPDGRLRLRGRQAKWITPDPLVTFSDDGAGVVYSDIVLDGNSVDPIRNIVASSYQTGYLKVSDATSTGAYGDSDELLSLPTIDSADTARGIANYRLRQRKDPKMRIPMLTVKPRSQPDDAFDAVLGLDLGDIIGVEITPKGIGSQIAKTLAVQGIAHDIRETGEWTTRLYLSPADDTAEGHPYLIVGDATYGRIGAAAGNAIPF